MPDFGLAARKQTDLRFPFFLGGNRLNSPNIYFVCLFIHMLGCGNYRFLLKVLLKEG